jgi:pimeloyl-ACP methyl ester carboxylesterase
MLMTIDGTHLDVLDEGSGPPLVLIHGFPLNKECWDEQAAALVPAVRVIRLDLRGMGRSDVTPGPYLMEQFAGDVAGVLDALGVERAVIAGHSMGGYISFAFYRMFAERVAGLGIIASRAGADTPEAAAVRLELADRAEAEGMAPVIESFVPRYFAPAVYTAQPEFVARATATLAATDPRGAAAALRGAAARVSSDDLLPDIDVPVLAFAGAQDAIFSVDQVRAISDGVKRGRLVVAASGHTPQWETPEVLSDALRALVAESF